MQNLEPAHDCFWNVIFWKIGCMSKRCGHFCEDGSFDKNK